MSDRRLKQVTELTGRGNLRSQPVPVTGSTGYVGGRRVPQLLSSGHRVRILGRSPDKLRSRPGPYRLLAAALDLA